MPGLLIVFFLFGQFFQENYTLTVTISHVRPGRGSVNAAIWADQKTFFKTPMLSETLKADQDSIQFVFKLKPGEYAISAYQDLNNNQKLDQGLFGIPKEPVAFGNDFKPKFSSPAFKDCSFRMSENMKMTIVLR
jgi:uncharacterized protein (DUF2141 family)